MVTDALRHAPKCLEYMAQLEDPQVFTFCAIPQVMAISTLAMCYGNGKVFEGVVKMRRGQTAVVRILDEVNELAGGLSGRKLSWCNRQKPPHSSKMPTHAPGANPTMIGSAVYTRD